MAGAPVPQHGAAPCGWAANTSFPSFAAAAAAARTWPVASSPSPTPPAGARLASGSPPTPFFLGDGGGTGSCGGDRWILPPLVLPPMTLSRPTAGGVCPLGPQSVAGDGSDDGGRRLDCLVAAASAAAACW